MSRDGGGLPGGNAGTLRFIVAAPIASREGFSFRLRRTFDWLDAGGAAVVLGGALVLYAAFVLWATRGTTLFIDEQLVFAQDRGFHPSALLTPLNGHLFLFE